MKTHYRKPLRKFGVGSSWRSAPRRGSFLRSVAAIIKRASKNA